ncbi:hypothetical protein CFE53_05220 [Methanofervidicoccus sp. A16]|uniref:DUF483 domain-containing protein n=1 Tax=Methanofervidicoccus sp. A16 TaxID=2607662 RepID=UPI0011883C06|nr:DUF483 domain-containing protein [Methanofervidicoccus sp. A16]AXI25556.1 hypothetical protein CFE53_05220 [Methanofervidicoccus sp. A16]
MDTIRVMEDILKKIVSIRKNQEEEDLKNISHLIRNMDDEIYSLIISRLKKEIEIVKKYKPPVRPAVDPLVSSYLGVYSGLDFAEEYGMLMGYPRCCIESFKSVRFAIDEEHLREVEDLKEEGKVAVVITSGFIPCSLKCKEAWKRCLIGSVSQSEYESILQLEEELFRELPHYHGGYGEYYEKIKLK